MTKQSANRGAKAGPANSADAWAMVSVAAWGAANLPGASFAQLPEEMAAAVQNDGRLATHSKTTYHYALKNFWGWKGERVLSVPTVEEWVARQRQRQIAVPTINKELAAIRWMAEFLSLQAWADANLPERQRPDCGPKHPRRPVHFLKMRTVKPSI